ncbi:MAG: hypothetical protein AB7Q92_04685 [Acidimicrobiia bacterium]
MGVLIGLSAVSFAAMSAGAQTPPAPELPAIPVSLPAGCPDGRAALSNVRWTTDSGRESDDLATLGAAAGDTVTVHWQSFAPGCTEPDGTPRISVSLAAYDGGSAPFDRTVDQRLVDGWASCGAESTPCLPIGGPYSIRLLLPDTGVSCAAQIDTVIGLPLGVIGPSGGYYSNITRGDGGPNLLIGAGSLDTQPCAAMPAIPTPATTAGTGVSSALPTGSGKPETAAQPSTIAPAAPPPTTTTAVAVLAGSVSVPPGAALPFTGTATRLLTVVASAALLAGCVLLILSRRQCRAT